MKTTLLLTSALGAVAFPHLKDVAKDVPLSHKVRELLDNPNNHPLSKRQNDALGISAAQTNCGFLANCDTFDAEGVCSGPVMGHVSIVLEHC